MSFNLLEGKKYSLSEDYVEYDGRKLYQIYRTQFLDIGEGFLLTERGGYVESEDNLSHEGNCWIEEGCCVYGNAKVEGNALIKCDEDSNPTILRGRITVKDNAIIVSSILQGMRTIGGNTVMAWNTVQKKKK